MAAGSGERAERQTSSWLTSGLHESVASLGVETLVYDDQAAPERLTKEHFEHLVRKLKILRWLDRLPCESFLDVGAGARRARARLSAAPPRNLAGGVMR